MPVHDKFGTRMERSRDDGGKDRSFYLFPEIIYAFHRLLHDIWDSYGFQPEDGKKRAIIVPSLFSKHTRTFHWFGVAKWDASKGAEPDLEVDPNAITKAMQMLNGSEWKDFCGNVTSCRLPGVLDNARRAVKAISDYATKDQRVQEDKWVEAFQDLLTLYSGYHHDRRQYLDGIILRNLEQLHQSDPSKRIDYLYGVLEGDKGTHCVEYQWVKIIEAMGCGEKLTKIKPFQCQELPKQEDTLNELSEPEKETINERPGFPVAQALTNTIFFNHVRGVIPQGQTPHVLVIPIYDVWIGAEAWGSLCGNLILFFGESDEDGYWKAFIGSGASPGGAAQESLLDKLRGKTRILSAEYFNSGLNLLLAQPITPPYDLIEHFLRNLNILQDWERVIVYRGTTPQYCYCWHGVAGRAPQEWNQREWRRCGCRSDTRNGQSCDKCPSWDKTEEKKKYLRWEQDLDIWSDRYLPGISDEEYQAFKAVRLVFEYPLTACIPDDDIKRKMLGEEYIRQHLEVLRGLIPKVRARQSALWTAAVTIMSRNMSHNIGSHVLAGMSSEQTIGFETSKALSELINGQQLPQLKKLSESFSALTKNLSQFIHYLQERMDFIADVATSSPLASLSQYIVRDTLWPLTQQAILLKAISGVRKNGNPVEARLKVWCNGTLLFEGELNKGGIGTADIRFGCPGGRMGAHAFYVILENIIRNTAKHSGTGADDFVCLSVNVSDTYRSQLEQDAVSHLIRVDVRDDLGTAWKKENGRSIKDNISAALQEAIIEVDGDVRSGNWGIREMLICAAYLRRCRLQDLEQEFSPPLLQVLAVDDNGQEVNNGQTAHLCYRFYVERAKDIVVLSDDENLWSIDKDRRSNLRRHGVEIVSGAHDVRAVLGRGLDHAMAVWLTPPKAVSGADLARLPVRIFVPEAKVKCVAGALPLSSDKLTKVETAILAGTSDGILSGLVDLWQLRCEHSFSVLSLAVLSRTDEARRLCPLWENGAAGCCHDGPVRKVIYDHHGVLHRDDGGCSAHEQCSSTHAELKSDIAFWEPYKKAEPIHTVLGYPPRAGDSRDIVMWQLVEAGLTTVAVIDERVQRQAHEEERRYGKEGAETAFRLMTVLSNMNVWVPSKGISKGIHGADLDAPDINAIQNWLAGLLANQTKRRLDFLVIHQGILDRLKDQLTAQGKTAEQWLKELTESPGISSVVVCSGRGRPAGLPAQARFAPVSSVLKWVVQSKSKYHLCQTLYASRRAHHG